MRYLVLSDLHHDFWDSAKRDPFEGLQEEIASLDLLILAGDVSNKAKVRWKQAFARLSQMIDPDRIHVFPGNHDFYDFRLDDEHRLQDFAAACGVHYANRTEIQKPGVRFLCTTLWTDLELPPGRAKNESYIPGRMNDYRYIRLARGGFRKIWPSDIIATHRQQKAWLIEQLQTPFSGETIVVTHHAPHPCVLPVGPGLEPDLAAAYGSDLGDMIETYQPAAWLFGHAHSSRSCHIGRTELSCVSLGYPFEVTNPEARIRSLIRTT